MNVRAALPNTAERLRQSFWLIPACGMTLGLVSGFGLVELDYRLGVNPGVFTFVDLQSARAVLETIATVTVSVAGLAFSVTVVALQLASQQLSPRVLRTFQGDRLSQAVLAVLLGTFGYALMVLAKLTERGVPALSVTVAIVGAVAAFGLFVAFIHHIVVSLKASTILKRISRDGREAVERRWPSEVGADPDDASAAEAAAHGRMLGPPVAVVRSQRAGFVSGVHGNGLMALAADQDLLIEQRAALGRFLFSGSEVARVWGGPDGAHDVADRVIGCFELNDERSLAVDVAYPVRQLADVALRALSPSLNDPTTAENAIDSMGELLVQFARAPGPASIRVDEAGVPRMITIVPGLDDLVRVGFEQVRVSAANQPVFARHVMHVLGAVAREARAQGLPLEEIRRQAELLRDAPQGVVPNHEDARAVREAYAEIDGV